MATPSRAEIGFTVACACASVCFAALLVSAAGCSRAHESPSGDAATGTPSASVLEGDVRAEWAAIKSKNAAAYGELLDEDFRAVAVDAEGTRTKAEVMRGLETSAVFDTTLSRLEARELEPNTALVTYEAFLQFSPSAQVRYLRVYVSEIWTRRKGAWRLLHYQETRVR